MNKWLMGVFIIFTIAFIVTVAIVIPRVAYVVTNR